MSNVSASQLFTEARTPRAFTDKALPENALQDIYNTMKFGATSMNCCPARIVFVTSQEAKQQLADCVGEGNKARILSAPATAIIATDAEFYEHMPTLFPAMPQARDMFAGNEALSEETAFRNSTLQGAYLMIAARSIGLDCAPMSGFDPGAVNSAFFADSKLSVNFICGLGYGDDSALYPRAPRLSFDEVCTVK